jgi:hypothetical protein
MMFSVSAVPTLLCGNSSAIFNDSQDDSSSYGVNLALVVIFLIVSVQLARSKARMCLIKIIYEDSCAHVL